VTPIDDVRSSADYRRRVVGNLAVSWVGGLDKAAASR
jgi:CO/xanthine dehydrogenase FAD-binding subunit